LMPVKSAKLTGSKAMDTDAKDDGPKKTRKVKKQVRKGDLPIVSATSSLEPDAKNLLHEKEVQMIADDKLVADTEEKKNELETYIYELRNKLDDQDSEFASEDEKDKIRSKLTDAEVSYAHLGLDGGA
jgi:heat shock 70kDa protein 4